MGTGRSWFITLRDESAPNWQNRQFDPIWFSPEKFRIDVVDEKSPLIDPKRL